MTEKSRQVSNVVRVLVFILVIAISIFIFSIRDQASQLAKFGYPGIFLLSILANATIILPAPSLLIVFAMGAVFNPWAVAVAAGAGAAIGELSGYLIGFSGQAIMEKASTYYTILGWLETHYRFRNLIIMVLAFIPNPLFDLAGIAAGTLKINVFTFLAYTFIGKTLKMILIAFAGASSFEWFLGR